MYSILGRLTHIKILSIIAILAIVVAVITVLINPMKHFGEAHNAERGSDIRTILDAINKYAIDNGGVLPSYAIPIGSNCKDAGHDICQPGVMCEGVILDELLVDEKYLLDIPSDPTSATDEITGYKISQSSNGRIGICAPSAYGDISLEVLR